jgi:hypothetical protein
MARQLVPVMALGSLLILASSSFAQTANPFGSSMPGQRVGSAMVGPVGQQLPKVGSQLPKVGNAPGTTVPKQQDAFGLQGYGIKPSQLAFDPKNIVSPYPLGPAGQEKDFWDKLYDRWLGLFESDTPTPSRNYTPGLTRRNRERKEERFRRD